MSHTRGYAHEPHMVIPCCAFPADSHTTIVCFIVFGHAVQLRCMCLRCAPPRSKHEQHNERIALMLHSDSSY